MIQKYVLFVFCCLGFSIQSQTISKEYRKKIIEVKKDTIQLSNLCFLFTKVGQVATFVYFGEFSSQAVQISFASMFIVAIGLYFGIKIKKKIDAKFYAKILKVLLFIIAWVLVFQTVEF